MVTILHLITTLLLLIAIAGCTESSMPHITQGGDEGMSITIDDTMTEDEIMTEAEKAERNAWLLEWNRTGGKYNIGSLAESDSYLPAPLDVDMNTIERFYFSDGGFDFGITFVLDRMHGGIHFDPDRRESTFLPLPFSTEFIQDDLDRLIQVINESNLVRWNEVYQGRLEEGAIGDGTWNVSILFSDGTMMRRRGSGISDDFYPPRSQWNILVNFIETMGAEIEQRHQAEAPSAE